MKPIEKTIHSQMMDPKHKLLFTLVLAFLIINSHRIETTSTLECKDGETSRLNIWHFLFVSIIGTNIWMYLDVW